MIFGNFYLLAMCPWASYLPYLLLMFPIFKQGIITQVHHELICVHGIVFMVNAVSILYEVVK